MNKTDQAARYLGLAARAGRVESGEFCTEKALAKRKAYLVVIAADASEQTKERFRRVAERAGVQFAERYQKEELGHLIGKTYRAVCAVTDERLAAQLVRVLGAEASEE